LVIISFIPINNSVGFRSIKKTAKQLFSPFYLVGATVLLPPLHYMSLLSSLHSAKSSGLFPQDSLKLYCLLPSFFFSCGRSFVSAIGTAYLYLDVIFRSIHFHYQLTFTSNCSVSHLNQESRVKWLPFILYSVVS
jgi:hypothetical protein